MRRSKARGTDRCIFTMNYTRTYTYTSTTSKNENVIYGYLSSATNHMYRKGKYYAALSSRHILNRRNEKLTSRNALENFILQQYIFRSSYFDKTMSYPTHDPNNPPPYFYRLTTKQQRNWRRNAKKMQKNEYLRHRHPPFTSPSTVNIVHIHHKSTTKSINNLIILANCTNRYVVDTESDRNKLHNDALIQIQFIHSVDDSTVILIETTHLPGQATELYEKIKELWCTIFDNNNNIIITWGALDNEFYNFYHLDIVNLGNPFQHLDLQSLFMEWHNERCITHPEMEMRDRRTGPISTNMVDITGDDDYDDMDDGRIYHLQYQCDHLSHDDFNIKWSLQDAIASTLENFLDKSQTVNHWQCGIDLALETWKHKLLSRGQYNKHIEQEQRQKMKQYAIDDCLAVAALYFYMYPE